MDHQLQVYIASPEGLLVDEPRIELRKLDLCLRYGFECLLPEQAHREKPTEGSDPGMLYATCAALMLRADVGIFDLTPVAGRTPDADTAFKLGMMVALGKSVYAYVNQDSDSVGRSSGLDDILGNPLVRSYFGMQTRKIILTEVAPQDLFRDLAGFEKCLRAARQDLYQVQENASPAVGFS